MLNYIDSYEKALIFWLVMVGLAFLSIIIGMELAECLRGFWAALDEFWQGS